MSTALYPAMLDLRGRRAVVIGGGAIATQKVRELVEAGARVRVIAPSLGTALAELATRGEVDVERREYVDGDLRDAWIAVAATDDRAVNAAVWREAERERVLLNAVDDVEHCHFIAPSVHREGSITITVSTAGDCPALAVRLRERIARLVRREHGELARLTRGWRASIARRVPDFATRRALWYRIVDALIDVSSLDHAPSLVEQLVYESENGIEPQRTQRDAEEINIGQSSASSAFSAVQTTGIVYLVGAGPGDAELITVRGLRLLRAADVVVHDRLVSAELLTHASPGARLICVGKHGHGESTPQEAIDALLIEEARKGLTVVRLKGGDPFVFGRGAEEVAALRAAGIEHEVVPGISSAIAAPGAVGIPVTHRELASGFAVVTGHECRSEGESTLDWSALARMPTLVVLMGLRALPRIGERLLVHGMADTTPAALVSNGTRPDQREVVGTLATIVERAERAALAQPATLIVGNVVGLRADSPHRGDYASEDRSTDSLARAPMT